METVFSFSRHWFEWKQFFGTVKLYFSMNASFWVVEMDHRLITNLVLLSRAFFCWWTPFLKLGVNQFSSIFSFLNSGSSFSGWWKQIFYKILHSWEWKRIFCQVFFYSEQILCYWKPLLRLRWRHFYRVTFLLLLETIFYRFFLIPACESSFSTYWKVSF